MSIDWTGYPLVRLFIPFLLGICAGYQCIIAWHWTLSMRGLFLTLSGLVCAQIVCDYILSKQPYQHKGLVFNVLTFIICFLFGLMLSAKRHAEAYNTYGDSFKYEIYRRNSFQNEKALSVQQVLHERFSKPSGRGGFDWSEHPDECAVVEAMTIGWRQGLSKELKQRYAHAGISHYLALSGYHVGIIFLCLLFIFKRISHSLTGRRWGNVVILLILWGYALLTGMSPSIVRATLMCSVITVFKLLERDIELVNASAFAAFVILGADPLLIGHIGFQLSFCSIFGIALMQRWIPWNFFFGGLSVCVICTIATAPLVAYHFGSIPLYGMLSNAYAMFLAPPILVLSLLWWIVTAGGLWISAVSDGIAVLLEWVTWSLNKIASSIVHFPYATFSVRLNIWEVIVCYGCILTFIRFWWRKMGAAFGFFKE